MLVTARDDPLLAQWQYGLGRSVAWTSDSTGRWAKSWIDWDGFSQFFSQMVGWTFPGEESGGIEADFVDRGGRTFLRVESVNADGSARDFYSTSVALVGPDLEPVMVNLSQVAPGVYEAPITSLESGAYAVRVTQTKPGAAPLGRTLGLVSPTAAEYRLLGANEPLLAAIRGATGGEELATPAAAWAHDLRATNRFTDTWPWLLVLALLLWPLDIALRRVSLGRRDFADGRRWIGDRVTGRRVAARTETTEGMLAARGRAGSSAARSAILREAATSAAPAPATAAAPDAPASASPDVASPAAVPTAAPAAGDGRSRPAVGRPRRTSAAAVRGARARAVDATAAARSDGSRTRRPARVVGRAHEARQRLVGAAAARRAGGSRRPLGHARPAPRSQAPHALLTVPRRPGGGRRPAPGTGASLTAMTSRSIVRRSRAAGIRAVVLGTSLALLAGCGTISMTRPARDPHRLSGPHRAAQRGGDRGPRLGLGRSRLRRSRARPLRDPVLGLGPRPGGAGHHVPVRVPEP